MTIKARRAGQPSDKKPRKFWSLPESERKSARVVVFLRREEKSKIAEAAKRAGCSTSVFVADVVLDKIEQGKQKGPQ